MSRPSIVFAAGIGLLVVTGVVAWNAGRDDARSPVVSADSGGGPNSRTPASPVGNAFSENFPAPGAHGSNASTVHLPDPIKAETGSRKILQDALSHGDGRSESVFINDNALQAARVSLLENGSEYREFVRDLSRNASGEAINRAAALRDKLSLGNDVAAGRVVVGEVGCGRSLCSFSITGADDASASAFVDSQIDEKNGSFPIFSQAQLSGQENGRVWIRVLLSTDSKVNAVHIAQ